MKHKFSTFGYLVLCIIMLAGCRALNPSIMLKTKRDFKYSDFPSTPPKEYKLAPNDELSFRIYSNDGFKLIDISAVSPEMSGRVTTQTSGLALKVEFDGTVKLPLLGRISLQGMTVREAETFLEEKYSAFYNKPYVLLEVTNRRVIVFPGSEGAARVVPLQHDNTTLLEALAAAGGIAKSGKAYKVKLIRGDLKNPEIYLIDLSTIDGIKQADLVLQANDIIYIEPQVRVGRDVMAEIMPYITFITTIILFVEFIKTRTP
jgi:polysaccharide export outer membrane protein